ncbi:MAG: cysteine desulfurase [Flavobacteriales bacterium]|jgi:cysteine desulfurase|nr:cysteine desulfurase [Flavobacteriales bacterium]
MLKFFIFAALELQQIMNVYLDNAATTPMAPEVFDAMVPYMKEHFGNPSSTHAFGRKTKNAIEMARKSIATTLNAEPSEIVFTSGGTEADNMALRCSVVDLGVERIITSTIEHHAVGHTAESLIDTNNVEVVYVKLDQRGSVDIAHLEELLKSSDKKTLVSLMHGNNEIGNLLPLDVVSKLCQENDALFHSDTVQTMGHYRFDLKAIHIDFITCAAHKFHGPKGVGFLYVNKKNKLNTLMFGGAQERGHRGGTENLYGIIGLGKAVELAYEDVEAHQTQIQGLKTYMKTELLKINDQISFNGEVEENKSLYTVLNVCFPENEKSGMFLFSLDINGIAASGGSACSSGSNQGSHVLSALEKTNPCQAIRFSFGRYTTKEEINYTLEKIKEML